MDAAVDFLFPEDSDECLVCGPDITPAPLDLRHEDFLYASEIDRGRGPTPGALQLAAAILARVGGRLTAAKWHWDFAEEVLATAPDSSERWLLLGDSVAEWLSGRLQNNVTPTY